MTRSDGTPSLDEYVAARGADLLRTAWYLTGGETRARDLAARTLGRAMRHWDRLTDQGVGAYDTVLRRDLVRAFLYGRTGDEAPVRTASSRLAAALQELPPPRRVVVVLRYVDDLAPARVADLLDVSVGTVESRAMHALAELGTTEDNLRAALPSLVPPDPATEGLAAAATAYAGRGRRVRTALASVVALVVLAVATAVAGVVGAPTVKPPPELPRPTRTSLSCAASEGEPKVLLSRVVNLGTTARQVLLCARTDEDSVWPGSLPPDTPLEQAAAIDQLELEPRTDGSNCPSLPSGPAFRLLLLDERGDVTSYANEGLACNGWALLAQYYVALAEQQAGDVAAPAGFLGCPSLLDRSGTSGTGRAVTPTRRATRPGLPRGSVFTQATACWHPLARADRLPRFLAIRSNVLGKPHLAQLNADARRAGSARTRLPACPGASSLVVIRALTSTGHLVELSGRCGSALSVDWDPDDVWTVSAETVSTVRSLLVVE